MNDFEGLIEYAVGGTNQPREDFFHSVYIAGARRSTASGEQTIPGKLQIRGLQVNLDRVHMIITHVKLLRVKEQRMGSRTQTVCFSFMEGAAPHHGTSFTENGNPRVCPPTSAERASVSFCAPCRSHIIVSGMLTNENGDPIMNKETNQPYFVFLRGKGTKFEGIWNYLQECTEMEYPPLLKDGNERFEKLVVNNKRHVTVIEPTITTNKHGDSWVFKLSVGNEITPERTMKILQISKETLGKFKEKFDWSERIRRQGNAVLSMEADSKKVQEAEKVAQEMSTSSVTLDDIKFDF